MEEPSGRTRRANSKAPTNCASTCLDGAESPDPGMDMFLFGLFPDDRTTDDSRRKREEFYTSFGPFSIYYVGYDQYGLNGESRFRLLSTNKLESDLRSDD
ncbi:MAG: hypothetical protein WD342_11940 [Verrucomicrobiales bacterium]